MNTPIPFEKQDPQGAQTLIDLYASGGVLVAYFWMRGFRSGVGRTPQTPNHPPIAILNNEEVIHLL